MHVEVLCKIIIHLKVDAIFHSFHFFTPKAMWRYSSSLLNSGEPADYHTASLEADLSRCADSSLSLLND